ncbi:MAG: site-specific integrase [Phycisphaerales bacterium]|nr:site-specific integrase [Phycisphaerales bacterium]
MSYPKPPKIPAFRIHKPTGQAYVYLAGKRRYLGRHDKPETLQAYHRLIAEWAAHGGQTPASPDEITIKELIARFWIHAEQYYRKPDGTLTSEPGNYRQALCPLRELYGDTRAAEFGPRALQAVRQRMIELGWCRTNINKHVGRIKSLFRWATEQEFAPGSIYQALRAVAGLKRGRCAAQESDPVKPVPRDAIEAIEPFVSRQIWALVQLQLLTAARAGELVGLCPRDIDRSGRIWIAAPRDHKTAHHGRSRMIYFGPRAQGILEPFLLRPDDAALFSPQEAEAARRREVFERRVTPLHHGNRAGLNKKARPQRTVGDVYDVSAYRRAIARACDQAFPAPEPLAKRDGESNRAWGNRLTAKERDKLAKWQKDHRWHPHQLRHNAATELRREFGIEVARIILGHRSPAITEVYAELDGAKAIEAMLRVG